MGCLISASPNCAGIALCCDQEGRILEIVGDELGLSSRFPTGSLFGSCLAEGSLLKSLNFLREVRKCQSAFAWEFPVVAANGSVRTLSFDGCVIENRLLILGAASSRELLGFLDDLMLIHNEQVNSLRFGLKELALKEAGAGRFQSDTYNELARLNNELANAQRELVKQNVELERLNRLKSQFLGMAAHDLRTPIGHIISCSDFLREEVAAELTEDQLEFLSVIQKSSEFMLQLIDDFLDVSAIESGNLRLQRQPGDLRQLLEYNIGLNAGLAQKKRIQVSLQIDGALPVLSFDEGKLTQVLNNLISNAVKFSQPGTAVTVSAKANAAYIEIAVRDRGPGIPEAERSKLFQPFGKTSVRPTAGESSTGLGLAIVRKIVEGHGGRIWMESEVGAGSAFLFRLPALERDTIVSKSTERGAPYT